MAGRHKAIAELVVPRSIPSMYGIRDKLFSYASL